MIDVDRFIALSDSRDCLTDRFMLHHCVWHKIGSCVSCQRPQRSFLLSGWDQTIKRWAWSSLCSWGWVYMTWFVQAPAASNCLADTKKIVKGKKKHLIIYIYFFCISTWILRIWLPLLLSWLISSGYLSFHHEHYRYVWQNGTCVECLLFKMLIQLLSVHEWNII